MEQDNNIIFILSSASDRSTDEVIKYLLLWKKNFIRVNPSDALMSLSVKMNNKSEDVELVVGNKCVNFNLIKSYWYRRGKFSGLTVSAPDFLTVAESTLYNQYEIYLKKEIASLERYIVNVR